MKMHVYLASLVCALAVSVSSVAFAGVVRGTVTGTVLWATDPGEELFGSGQFVLGRPPQEWAGKQVTGTFEYEIDSATPISKIADRWWVYGPPAISIVFNVDGSTFETKEGPIFTGVGIEDDLCRGDSDCYYVQNSVHTTTGPYFTMSEKGIRLEGPNTLFSYQYVDGAPGVPTFTLDTCTSAPDGLWAYGSVNERIFVPDAGGTQEKAAVIFFSVTSVCLGRTPAQIFDDLEDTTVGIGPRSVNNGVRTARAHWEAGDIESAGLQIEDTENQVGVFMGAPQANPNRIESEPGNKILRDFAELKEVIGYESN